MSSVQDQDSNVRGSRYAWLFSMSSVALIALVVQSTSLVLCIKWAAMSRPEFSPSALVFASECTKFLVCVGVVVYMNGSKSLDVFKTEVFGSTKEMLKISVPALLYAMQNQLLYVAIANLPAPVYSSMYNAKILTTALFSVVLLGRVLARVQWGALLLLVIGLSLAQYAPGAVEDSSQELTSRVLGLACVAAASVTSGLAGVYFELLLKSSSVTLWVRNVQLALTSMPIAYVFVLYQNSAKEDFSLFPFAQDWLLVSIVLNQAIGGLLIAVVVRYTSQLTKSVAAGLSIISSSIASAMVFQFELTGFFITGSSAVLLAAYCYANPTTVEPYAPAFLKSSIATQLPK